MKRQSCPAPCCNQWDMDDICTIWIGDYWHRNSVHEQPVAFFWICRSWENQTFRCFVGDPQVELPPLSSARKSPALRVFGGWLHSSCRKPQLLHMNTYDKRGWPTIAVVYQKGAYNILKSCLAHQIATLIACLCWCCPDVRTSCRNLWQTKATVMYEKTYQKGIVGTFEYVCQRPYNIYIIYIYRWL